MGVVTSFLRHRILRLPIIAISALAWLSISNHCALAEFGALAKVTMANCHDSGSTNHAPAKRESNGGVECCKVLRATLLPLAKSLAPVGASILGNQVDFATFTYPSEQSQKYRLFEW